MALPDDQSGESFHYEALSKPRHIRLLKLLPADSKSDDITCTLEQAGLDDNTQYEALSYTWGNPVERSKLYCNGKTLSVTKNLGTALRYLRPQSEPRSLWVDAICINQADIEERNQQVALMRDVYSSAFQVIAWLGEEHSSDSAAMWFGDPKPLPANSSTNEKTRKILGLQSRLPSSLISARYLIQRPWFSRAWIIQEAALAKNLQVQCGEKLIDWESLYANLKLLDGMVDAKGAQVTFNNDHYARLEFIESTRQRMKAENIRSAAKSPRDMKDQPQDRSPFLTQFHAAVVSGRSYGATDPRDHIYALTGLVDVQDLGPLSVDYSLTYDTIIRNFVRYIIQQTSSLTALGQVDSQSTTRKQSWIPDYSRPCMVDPLSSDRDPFYTASGDSATRIRSSPHDPFLTVSGIFFDTIDEVAMGPSTDKEKIFSRSERMAFQAADKVHPTEILPKLAYKAISHYSPLGKEIVDAFANATHQEPEVDSAEVSGLSDRDRHYKQMYDLRAAVHLADSNEDVKKQVTTPPSPFSAIKDLRQRRQNYVFGPIHSRNDVYMKPGLEEQWQRLAKKCSPYPNGEEVENAYWRTLVGNKRSNFVGTVDKPPNFWRDAYNLWHEELWANEGMVPRFLNGRGLGLGKGIATFGGTFVSGNQEDNPLSADLSAYLRGVNAEQNRAGNDRQLKASGMRAFIASCIDLARHTNDTPNHPVESNQTTGEETPKTKTESESSKQTSNVKSADLLFTQGQIQSGLGTLSRDTLDRAAKYIQKDPLINTPEEAQLREILLPLAFFQAAKDDPIRVQRAKIEQAFRYDFLRVARNRKFCITRKKYMGWCPFYTQPGDRVCILFGGQTPYAVRKEGEGYRMLGEAYVHGEMDGEVLGMEGVRIESIRLV
ncbi:MAG: hypothetical protein Q9222_001821 [Ikaeria aurantiellina]